MGESFVQHMYPPGCKDNVIYSRLFLTARCCVELDTATSVELQVFEKLRSLVTVHPFRRRAALSLSKLHVREAINVLIELLPDHVAYISYTPIGPGIVSGVGIDGMINKLADIHHRFQSCRRDIQSLLWLTVAP